MVVNYHIMHIIKDTIYLLLNKFVKAWSKKPIIFILKLNVPIKDMLLSHVRWFDWN